jgi:hypothetical protein
VSNVLLASWRRRGESVEYWTDPTKVVTDRRVEELLPTFQEANLYKRKNPKQRSSLLYKVKEREIFEVTGHYDVTQADSERKIVSRNKGIPLSHHRHVTTSTHVILQYNDDTPV